MPGTKGHSGGKREGAGRPVKSRSLHVGDKLLHHEFDAAGHNTLGQMAEVESLTRTRIVIRLEDGSQIVLGY